MGPPGAWSQGGMGRRPRECSGLSWRFSPTALWPGKLEPITRWGPCLHPEREMTVHWKDGWEDGQPSGPRPDPCTPDAWGLQCTAPCRAAVCQLRSDNGRPGAVRRRPFSHPPPPPPGTQADTSSSPGPPPPRALPAPGWAGGNLMGASLHQSSPWTSGTDGFHIRIQRDSLLNALVFVL